MPAMPTSRERSHSTGFAGPLGKALKFARLATGPTPPGSHVRTLAVIRILWMSSPATRAWTT
ncbi:MAG: hypothetical protein F4X92_01825 [Gammaproteobacteria bacterium]|nr:hypothetical protein [Gammaproteobacteria bacterium]